MYTLLDRYTKISLVCICFTKKYGCFVLVFERVSVIFCYLFTLFSCILVLFIRKLLIFRILQIHFFEKNVNWIQDGSK
jgi:hypothetical protein